MSRASRSRGCVLPFAAALTAHALASALAAAGDGSAPPRVYALTQRTMAETGTTRVIAFRVERSPQADLALEAQVSDRSIIDIVHPPQVLAGESLGFLRVRGLRPGTAEVSIGGSAFSIVVVPPRSQEALRRLQPRLVGPSDGAVVWGRLAVGVELRETPGGAPRSVVVQLSNGDTLEPIEDSELRLQPYRQLRFELDGAPLRDGLLELTPIAIEADGTESRGRAMRVLVAHPGDEQVTAGEAEARYEVERPQRFGDARVTEGRDADASGGRFFANAAAAPAVCFPVEVEQPGWYQLVLVAGGTRAQAMLPAVGVVIDGENQSRTNGRLLSESWHRLVIGVPFRLERGDHVITPYFVNDFYVPQRVDRNLHLDRIEVARVADDGAPPTLGTVGGDADDGSEVGVVDCDPLGCEVVPLRVGFVRPLHGMTLPGLVEIEGRCWWDNPEGSPAPVVTLWVNRKAVAQQRSGAPRFWVDPSSFSAGDNRVQLVARLDDGFTAATPVQTMHWPAAPPEDERPPARRHYRFSIHDERWEPDIRDALHNKHYPKERRAAALFSNGEFALNLPEDAAGEFHVFLEVLGEHFEGAPIARVSLRVGQDETLVGEVEAPTWWDANRRVGDVELPEGPKQLVVAFTNDKHEPDKGDRNLWLQAVVLAQEATTADRTAPTVAVRYPPVDHEAYLVDALVAEASDNASLRSAELVLDGFDTGMAVELNLKPGRVVFPLLLRDLEPGEHTFAVRVTDVTGNSTLSESRTIRVRSAPPETPGRYARAVHLLNRFAFGPDADQLAEILTRGETQWLADCLAKSFEDADELAALGATLPYFPNRGDYEVTRRVIAHLLLTPNPVRARLVLWAQNHFSTWIRKTAGVREWDEHVAFSRLGAAPFGELLRASAESPAMLAYLDQQTSFAGRLNENYAREVMELHTLGVGGGYSQEDVTRLARLLTGWTVAFEGDGRTGGQFALKYSFRFDPRLNDGAETTVIGVRFPEAGADGRYDRVQWVLETLAAHPSTARFVSRSLAEHYVRMPVPDQLVEDLSRVYLETDGDLRAMLRAIAEHPAFWDPANADRVMSPLDYGIRLCRTTRHFQPWQIGDFLQRAGQGLFDRATPDGYPEEDAAYTDSNALLQRWRLARECGWPLTTLVPNGWRYGNGGVEPDWRQRVVDAVAIRLTGLPLNKTSNEAALELLDATSGNRDQRVQALAPFIAQLSEANLR